MSEQYDVYGGQAGDEKRGALKRRGLIAGAAALVAGILAKQAAEPVAAGTDGDVVLNSITPSGATTGVVSSPLANSPALIGSNNFPVSSIDFHGDGVQGYTINPQTTPPTSNAGVFGRVNELNGVGIFGEGPNGTGVFGDSGSGSGVAGNSTTGYGVYGISNQSTGVYGTTSSYYGVYGVSGPNPGAAGLLGFTNTASGTAFGSVVVSPATLAGYFNGEVHVHGGAFVVDDMSMKHGTVTHQDGTKYLMYSMEAPESWIEDFGTGTFANGTAEVKINPDFAGVAHIDDYHVFVTEIDGHHNLSVHTKTAGGFTVKADTEVAALKGKTAADLGGTFSYRVVAKPNVGHPVARMPKYELAFDPEAMKKQALAIAAQPPSLPKTRRSK